MASVDIQTSSLPYLPLRKAGASHSLDAFDQSHVLNTHIAGFPSQYEGARVWSGPDMALKNGEWVVVLSAAEQQNILKALRHFQSLNLLPGAMNRQRFPLPKELSNRLRNISHDCYNGRGFCVLRGLRPEAFTEEENVLVLAGISSYVAPVRGFQDINRELVACHVISEETKPGAGEQKLRPAFTNGALAFHTDVGDILTLYAVDVSGTAGETMIVSSSKIYNDLAKTRPDLLRELTKKWACMHSQNYETDGTPNITNAPGDKLILQYSRIPVTGFRNLGPNPTLPAPNPKRLEAMDMIEELALKHSLALPRQKGDIVYINNMCLMHGRNAFDLDAKGNPLPSKRHLVKLMLQDPELKWDIPESLDWVTKRAYGPNRENGERVEKWQLTIGPDKSVPDGMIWVGSGGHTNG